MVPLDLVVVVPAFDARRSILPVLGRIGPEVTQIVVVDDDCPGHTGRLVKSTVTDPRVRVVFNRTSLGVGGATIRGFRAALEARAGHGASDVAIVRLDGDGRHSPDWTAALTRPIRDGLADAVKGNRFHDVHRLKAVPTSRLVANAALTFMAKASTGYWTLFDPTNSLVAVHGKVAARLLRDRIDGRRFFDTDLLFRLYLMRAKVAEVPIDAIQGTANGGPSALSEVFPFACRHALNTLKRIFYTYFVRNFGVGSVQLLLGLAATVFGVVYGAAKWLDSEVAMPGTVMLAALPVFGGINLLLAFLAADIGNEPRDVLHPYLGDEPVPKAERGHAPDRSQSGPTR